MMEEPEWEREEVTGPPVISQLALPFGLRVTILFVRAVIALIVLPTLFSGVLAVWGIVDMSYLWQRPFDAIANRVIVWVSFVGLVTMLCSATWLHGHLGGQTQSADRIGVARSQDHVVRQIFFPALAFTAIYSFLAVLMWVPSLVASGIGKTYPWPLFWGSVGGGSVLLYRYLDRILPK
ncbi:hypothetical protein [Luteolibacter soli]|uniref:Uncharacterized protein n=1 Tax=Luteolibacter soli TaxID=3135280 RepID=A0ABU9AUH8_9BACT